MTRSIARYSPLTAKGFTLVEMVTVIIILGILAIGVSSFITLGTRIFIDSTSVAQVLSESRFVIERMTRELRNAVPNSLRVDNSNLNRSQCIEFVPIQASAAYIELPIAPDAAGDSGTVMIPSQGLNDAHQMLVYPLQLSDIYNQDPAGTEGNLLDVKDFDPDTNTVEFDRDVRFSEASPRKRYYMVNGAVSYCFLINGDIRRYADYGLHITQPQPESGDMGSGVLMAQDVINNLAVDPPITFSPGTLINNAVVQLTPEFAVNGQSFQYQHQVQVVNVP